MTTKITLNAYSNCINIMLTDLNSSGNRLAGVVLDSRYSKVTEKIQKFYDNDVPLEEALKQMLAVFRPVKSGGNVIA